MEFLGFVLVGFSMGGNLVLKLAGEWGSDGPAPFRGVAAVCPGGESGGRGRCAARARQPGVRILFSAAVVPALSPQGAAVSRELRCFTYARSKTLREFDDRVTAYYCGFTGADDYYARAAAANVIDRIARPALVIHAANDPFIRILPETRRALLSNRNISYIETEDGGHCAFVGERDGDSAYDGRWAEREVVEFAKQFR